jgi:putative SOS response-associated peptidase YedK
LQSRSGDARQRRLLALSKLEPRYDVCRTDSVGVVLLADNGQRRFEQMRWSVVPCWWLKSLKEMRLRASDATIRPLMAHPKIAVLTAPQSNSQKHARLSERVG